MKMASRLIDLISKKKKPNCPCSTLFLLISKKQICTWRAASFFVFPLPLFCTPTTLFCTNKTSNVLATHYFQGGIVVCAYPIFCFLCSYSFLFFTAAHAFSPCWPLVFVIFSQPLWCTMFFFLLNWFPLFSITRSSSFSVIHVSVNIKKKKKKTTKKTRLCCCFFFLTVRAAMWFPSK